MSMEAVKIVFFLSPRMGLPTWQITKNYKAIQLQRLPLGQPPFPRNSRTSSKGGKRTLPQCYVGISQDPKKLRTNKIRAACFKKVWNIAWQGLYFMSVLFWTPLPPVPDPRRYHTPRRYQPERRNSSVPGTSGNLWGKRIKQVSSRSASTWPREEGCQPKAQGENIHHSQAHWNIASWTAIKGHCLQLNSRSES